jgi:hypothetical protein
VAPHPYARTHAPWFEARREALRAARLARLEAEVVHGVRVGGRADVKARGQGLRRALEEPEARARGRRRQVAELRAAAGRAGDAGDHVADEAGLAQARRPHLRGGALRGVCAATLLAGLLRGHALLWRQPQAHQQGRCTLSARKVTACDLRLV